MRSYLFWEKSAISRVSGLFSGRTDRQGQQAIHLVKQPKQTSTYHTKGLFVRLPVYVSIFTSSPSFQQSIFCFDALHVFLLVSNNLSFRFLLLLCIYIPFFYFLSPYLCLSFVLSLSLSIRFSCYFRYLR